MATEPRELSEITTLVFDVMGTVVDVDTSIRSIATAALRRAGVADELTPALLEQWSTGLQEHMDAVIAGAEPWRGHRELRRAALRETLSRADLDDAFAATADELTAVIGRCEAFPDSAQALARLSRSHAVVALSNADTAELVTLSAQAGLTWHGVLSGEFARSYKPAPAVYAMAVDLLDVQPSQLLMVAAHGWDLTAAADLGMATAFVKRPGATPAAGADFDVEVADLAALADLLGG